MTVAKFDLSATVLRSMVHSDPTWDVTGGRAIIVGPITFPTGRISGSGEWATYLSFEMAAQNRVVIQRRTTVDGTGAVTADTLQCRLVAAGTDSAPQSFPWPGQTGSTLPPGTLYLKLGFTDATTCIFQVAAADLAFVGVTTRVASGFDFTLPGFIEFGVNRLSGNVIPATMVSGRVYGTKAPDPNPGGTVIAGGDTSLHFAGDALRVFPSYTGNIGTLLTVIKPTSVTRVMTPVSQSRSSQGTLDTFTRGDNASLGGNWTAAGFTMPSVATNRALGSTTVVAGALWANNTFTANNSAFLTIGVKPANPAALVAGWIRVICRAAGTGATLQAYCLSMALRTDGQADVYITRILNGAANGSAMTGGAGVLLGTTAAAVGDSFGVRVVGTTLQGFRKAAAAGSVWTQIGVNVTDSSLATGSSIGFNTTPVTATATAIDDFSGATELTTTGTFPADQGARYMRVHPVSDVAAPRTADYYDATLTPAAGLGGALTPVPPAWVMIAVCRDATTGIVSIRMYDPTADVFTQVENAGTLAAGAAITDSAARFVIGGRQPKINAGDYLYDGDVAAVALSNVAMTAANFVALVQSKTISPTALQAIPGVQRAYVLSDRDATSQIMDIVGTAHEITGEAVGTLTVATDTGNVPVTSAGGGGGGGGGTPVVVPDPSGFAASLAVINPFDTTHGSVHLHVTAPEADIPNNFTPNDTPVQFLHSTDGLTWTGYGWQAGTEYDVGDATLSPPDVPVINWYTVQYRDASATPVVGDLFVPAATVVISSIVIQVPMTAVDNLLLDRTTTQITASWDVPPAGEGVTSYEGWIQAGGGAIDYVSPPAWTAVGTTAAGRVTGPPFSAPVTTERYRIGIKPVR